jgi:alginate O-acetyltransferase complex protein AlgI
MLFSSIPFLYYFLPLVLAVYFLTPARFRNAVLLLASLIFYAWGEPKYVLLMLASILSGYGFGLLQERYRGQKGAKLVCGLSVAVSLSFLLYFKYADFFLENFNAATGLGVPLLHIALPIGISFYTFQIISYTVDVYRGSVQAQKNLLMFAAYVAMFPQLVAGPIVRYSDIRSQLENRMHSVEKCAYGIRRFVTGLSKKILIANVLGELIGQFQASEEKSVLFFWMYAVAFMLQIYFDFSGYSDMAVGLGAVFGFDFPENFRYPYCSASITEFWRRWHISLGAWFRDYLYIPLGGSHVKPVRWIFNIFLVWMATGFWHGAAWNFILWGLMYAVLLLIEKTWLLPYLKKHKIVGHLYVLFFVLIGFVLFDASSVADFWDCIVSMFGGGQIKPVTTESLYYLKSYAGIILTAVIGATPLPVRLYGRLQKKKGLKQTLDIAEILLLVMLLLLCVAFLVDGSFNPFLYFRF